MVVLLTSLPSLHHWRWKLKPTACLMTRLMRGAGIDPKHWVIGLHLIDSPSAMINLNWKTRNKKKITDILTFRYADCNSPLTDKDETGVLGEIAVCWPVIAKRVCRNRYSRSFPRNPIAIDNQLVRLLVHGICHLKGLDHVKLADYQEMLREETKILYNYYTQYHRDHQFGHPITIRLIFIFDRSRPGLAFCKMVDMASLVVGKDYSVTMNNSSVFKGRLYHIDSKLAMIALLLPIVPAEYKELPVPVRPSVSHDIHILNIDQVRSAEPIKLDIPEDIELPKVGPLNPQRVARRGQRIFRQRMAELGYLAPSGATEEAQAIFSAISKTLPCVWHQETAEATAPVILVMDEISICAPYTPASCRGTAKTPLNILERVKKVVEGERKRLGLQIN